MAIPNQEHNQFKPGHSGNPNGRPKGKSLSTILRKLLEGSVKIKEGDTERSVTRNEQIALALLEKASKGDVNAIKEIFDRTEGKSPQSIDHTTKGESLNKQEINLSELSDATLAELESKLEGNQNGTG